MTAAPPAQPRPATAPAHYLVYLSGIGEVDAGTIGALELGYLRRLTAQLPDCVIVHDLFTYAVDNVGLTEERWLGASGAGYATAVWRAGGSPCSAT